MIYKLYVDPKNGEEKSGKRKIGGKRKLKEETGGTRADP